MNWTEYFVPSEHRRLNEFVGLLVLTLGILLALSLVSFNPDDPSFNISQNPQFAARPTNFVGVVGAYGADVFLQTWGYSAFLLPMFLGIYAFYWLASWPVKNFAIRLSGMILMMATIATTLGLSPFRLHDHILPGGLIGKMLADTLRASFNSTGSVVVLVSVFFVSLCRIFATAVPLRLQSGRAMVRLAGRTRTRESDSKSGAEKAKDAKETNDRDREGGHGGGPLGPEPRGRGDRPRVPSSACCRPRCSTETKGEFGCGIH